MKIFGIAGYSGSGKTTLLEKLIPQLTARGRTRPCRRSKLRRFRPFR